MVPWMCRASLTLIARIQSPASAAVMLPCACGRPPGSMCAHNGRHQVARLKTLPAAAVRARQDPRPLGPLDVSRLAHHADCWGARIQYGLSSPNGPRSNVARSASNAAVKRVKPSGRTPYSRQAHSRPWRNAARHAL